MLAKRRKHPSPSPTDAESAINPTITIHDRYNQYRNQVDMNAIFNLILDIPNLVCTCDNFYLSLVLYLLPQAQAQAPEAQAPEAQAPEAQTPQTQAQAIFRQCAIQPIQPIQPQGEGERAVNDAIRAYSTLINNLLSPERIAFDAESIHKANDVVQFLTTDYDKAMRNDKTYIQEKNRILLLFGEDMLMLIMGGVGASVMHSRRIYDQLKELLREIFMDEFKYIDSPVIVKHLILLFLPIDPPMLNIYRNASPLQKSHFYIHILNNNAFNIISKDMQLKIFEELINDQSPLCILLFNEVNPNNGTAVAFAQRYREYVANQAAAAQAAAAQAALARAQNPFVQFNKGAGGSQKRTLRNGKKRTLRNGKKRTLRNGKKRTLRNGKKRTLNNSKNEH
jgi:hypothetical protein